MVLIVTGAIGNLVGHAARASQVLHLCVCVRVSCLTHLDIPCMELLCYLTGMLLLLLLLLIPGLPGC